MVWVSALWPEINCLPASSWKKSLTSSVWPSNGHLPQSGNPLQPPSRQVTSSGLGTSKDKWHTPSEGCLPLDAQGGGAEGQDWVPLTVHLIVILIYASPETEGTGATRRAPYLPLMYSQLYVLRLPRARR